MKKSLESLMMAATISIGACSPQAEHKEETGDVIGKSEIRIENGLMTAEVLQSFGRVGDVKLSPDLTKILYSVTYVNVPQNKSNKELFLINTDGSDNTRITTSAKSENNPVWLDGGKRIAFLTSQSGTSQMWVMNADGSGRKQISNYEGGIDGFLFSPDQKKVLFYSNIKYGRTVKDLYPDLDKATGAIYDDVMYKHWDEWVKTVPHPYIAEFTGSSLKNICDIMPEEPFECPMKPFGGVDDFAWSPDSKKLVYTCRKKTGLAYSISTNSDLYLYDLENKSTINLTEGMMGYDTAPAFSADGSKLAWKSMERDGYESDQIRLYMMDMNTGKKNYLTSDFDNNVEGFIWASDNKTIYFLAVKEATEQIFRMDILSRTIEQITTGDYDYASLALANDNLIVMRHSMSAPNEIYSVETSTKIVTQLTSENNHILDQLKLGKVEKRWIKTTDGKEMLTWVMLPSDFDPNKKYPALLYCQGGPQSAVSQFWSYRWNIQMMAANGYVVVLPNRRGVPGFGQAWNEQISGDYGGQNMKDYMSAINSVKQEPWVDEERLGAIGASYGGFSVYWLAGNHNKTFKTFISHAGIFNLEAQYLETEELWFANWDMGGNFWNENNQVAQRTYANSPHRFVQNWDTPILVTHGELDYRILASQGMMAFNAAVIKGIPAEMLVFPDENHWIMQPQNGVLWQRVFFRWLDRWLKEDNNTKQK
ncbi:MAG: prolyl oligopeptidase family serine peptidase [Bacteroidales bacterium]